MNTQHRDILTAIGRKQPITTAGIAEYLMYFFGYGGGMEFDVFRDQVSKTIGYLKSKGEIVGEDIPQWKPFPRGINLGRIRGNTRYKDRRN